MSETEQDKTEEATPYKLRKAREKGQIAKGMDLPFFGSLIGLTLFVIVFGQSTINTFSDSMSLSFSEAVQRSSEDNAVERAIGEIYKPAIMIVLTLGVCSTAFVLLMQILQNKGLLFTTDPLKPDFTKLNPAKGLKRIFSIKTLKEAGKNILKLSIYLGGSYLIIRHNINIFGQTLIDAKSTARALFAGGMTLLYLYLALSFIFALIDQVIVRKEFSKQMKMSRFELKREIKDREGEPRIKQKRKELHKNFAEEMGSMGDLPGSDILIVNPQHYAVALSYDSNTMTAPVISSKGRNKYALLLKVKATRLGIPILTNPPLARALYRAGKPGQTIPQKYFKDVADSYIGLLRKTANPAMTDLSDRAPE